jgi:hypothetical protein
VARLEELDPRLDAAAVVVDVGEVLVGVGTGIGRRRNPVDAIVGPELQPLGIAGLVGQTCFL